MIGLDTNILVRFLTQDDPEQAELVNRLIETQCSKAEPGFIALIVLCELVWVLRGAYGYKKALVIKVLTDILATGEFEVENPKVARCALSAYRRGAADFADYAIACINDNAGCSATYSFDQQLAKHHTVRLP